MAGFPIPWAHRVPDTGPANHVFGARPWPGCSRYRTPTVFPLPDPPTRCPIPCPEGGIAYQPRVPTLGIHPKKESRVLKERRIGRVSWASTPPFLCGVPSEHTDSMACGSQGDALGWYAMPIQGIVDDNSFDTVGPPWFRYRTRQPCFRSPAMAGLFPIPDSHRVPVTRPANHVFGPRPWPGCCRYRTPTAFPLPDPPTTCPIPCPEGASHTSPGCKPWESPRQKNPAF